MPVAKVGLRERHKQERRERILEAIRQLLRESPDETPTAERIAELADLSPASVFNLVGPRQQQWEALGDALMGELDTRLAGVVDEDPREQARRIVGETVELFITDPAVFGQLVSGWRESGRLLHEHPVPRLRSALRRGQVDGTLRPDLNVEALVGHIATAASGALRSWAGGEISDRAFRMRVRFAVDVVFAAGASEQHLAELSAPLRRAPRRRSR